MISVNSFCKFGIEIGQNIPNNESGPSSEFSNWYKYVVRLWNDRRYLRYLDPASEWMEVWLGWKACTEYHRKGIFEYSGKPNQRIFSTKEWKKNAARLERLISVGSLLDCQVIDIQTGKELNVDQNGEICMKGPQVMTKYHNSPEATASTIDDKGWLHTGLLCVQYLD